VNADAKPAKLHWLKYNPAEWEGMFPRLTDQEWGLFHRIVARLWATPGNRLSLEGLLSALRERPGGKRAKAIDGLIGYALVKDEAGLLYVPALDDAFSDAIRRCSQGTAAATARWSKTETGSKPASTPGNPGDF